VASASDIYSVKRANTNRTEDTMMMNNMMDCCGGVMMWGMGLVGLLVVLLLVLGVAALVKYLLFNRKR
jgi:hypothetical protein